MIPTGIFQWLFIILGLSIWITYTSSKEIRVVCYYTNWSIYRPGTAKFSPQNINPYLCTHLIYAFGGFTKENTLKPFDKYQDIEKGGYAKFTGLKTYNKNLKTLLAIGGWNEASSRFSPMVANPDRRKQLVKNSIKFLRQNHFDGLDLDWEYPAFREGGKPRDKENYAKLVQELREEFDRESEKTGRPRLLLTMAVPAGIEYINKGYDIPKLTKYLDWMNILSYDYHSAFEPAVNHHAPLYPLQEATEYDYDGELNIDYTIKHYLELGADPEKLVVGIPTYGRSYTLFNPDANAMGDPADGPGEMGEATRENGYLAYYEICENVKSNDWNVIQPNEKAMGPYAYKDNQWVGYDDENIARRKAEYVVENGLGGIMFWAIDNDDFRGNCHGKPYPLIEAGKEALINALGLTDENLISPPAKPLKPKNRHRNRPKTTEAAIVDDQDETTKSSVSRRRNRLKAKANNRASSSDDRPRRKEAKNVDNTSTHSSLKVITPAYTTPEPPSTPDQGGAFKCEDEGFFPHPKDCKKYFWCLSGPGELGIVAHQFTCPAGLYFNKAADSCDYSQNVLCNKKLSKTTSTTEGKKNTESTKKTTTTTQRTSTKAPVTRTTARTTTTTEEAYDDDYEYEDEEDNSPRIDSEEDPKVIKELLDLIKKAGGIEELEKQLNLSNDEVKQGVTTPSTRTKSIVEKFLTIRTNSNNNSVKNKYSTINRNSRGPQNEGLNEKEAKDSTKQRYEKPQYTTIQRRKPSPSKTLEEDDEEDEQEKEKSSSPRYFNIRRNKGSSTTEDPVTRGIIDRNKILGEEDKDTEDSNRREVTVHTTPQYVNIRRQRPSTTEKASTSGYVSIRRSTTQESPTNQKEVEENTTVKKQTSKTATTLPRQTSTLRYQFLNRHSSSTTTSASTETAPSTEPAKSSTSEPIKSEPTSSTTTEALPSTTTAEITSSPTSTELSSAEISSTEPEIKTTKLPSVLEPRPFSVEPIPTISTTQKPLRQTVRSTTISSKVSDTIIRSRTRPKLNSGNVITKRVFGVEENSVELGSSEKFDSTTRSFRNRNRYSKPDESSVQPRKPSFRQRARLTTTQKVPTDKDEEEIQRKYRPLGLDDLSSLTAADFIFQGNNKDREFRRSRIRLTTTTDSTPQRTGSDVIPTRRRTVITRKNNLRKNDITDQVKANTNEIAITKQDNNEINNTSSDNTRRNLKRTRKVLRRLRTSTPQPNTSKVTVTHRGKPFSYSSLKFNEGVDSSKTRTNILVTDSDSSEPISSEEIFEEDENIKLSATNIRENSNTNNGNTIFDNRYEQVEKDGANFEKSRYGSRFRITTGPTTLRTRKIIRKFRPTDSSFSDSFTTSRTTSTDIQQRHKEDFVTKKPNRGRKVIRRLRPNYKPTFLKDNSEEYLGPFINKAQVPQFIEKKSTVRGRDKVSKNTEILNRFGSTEIEDVPSRGTVRYIDIVRSTTSLDELASSMGSDDGFTIWPTTESVLTSTAFEEDTSSSHTDITSKKTSRITSESSTTSEFLETIDYITTPLLNDTDELGVTTVSSFQESNSSDDSTTNLSTSTENLEGISTKETSEIEEYTTIPPLSSSEATTEYIRKSTLRSSRLRPTYRIRKITTSTTTDASQEQKESSENNRLFSRKKPSFRQKLTTEKSSVDNASEKPRRRYPFGKNRTTFKPSNDIVATREDTDKQSSAEKPSSKQRFKYFSRSKNLSTTEVYKTEATSENAIVISSTDSSTTESSLAEKQRSRNKALFSKNRKMNVPVLFSGEQKEEQTTEHLTTLYHVFAEPEIGDNETNAITKNDTHINSGGKVERVVEINRIIEVHVKNGDNNKSDEQETKGIIDKIGAINRITSIQVVDGNETNTTNSALDQTNQRLLVVHDIIEQERKNQRKDRKFDINLDTTKAINSIGGAEIIDGISHIKILTPRPLLHTEASTIALEGLFSTTENSKSDTPTLPENELLDTDYSRFVNIKVLKPENGRSLGDDKPADTPRVVRILPNDEDVTMEAKVVEVTPRNLNQTIRIAPIQVSMSRSIADSPIVGLNKLNEKIGNTPFRLTVDSGVP